MPKKKSLPTDIKIGDRIFPYRLYRNNFHETDKGIFLNPEFYYVYEMIRTHYAKHTPEDKLLEVLEDGSNIYTYKLDNISFFSKEERLNTFESSVSNNDIIHVQKTGLLNQLMEYFYKEYLMLDYRLCSRNANDYEYVSGPKELDSVFCTLGLDIVHEETNKSNTEYGTVNEKFLVNHIRNRVIGETNRLIETGRAKEDLIPWKYIGDNKKDLLSHRVDNTHYEKTRTYETTVGASSLLFILGDGYFNEDIGNKVGFPKAPKSISELLTRGRIYQSEKLRWMNEQEPIPFVMEYLSKHLDNNDKERLAALSDKTEAQFSAMYFTLRELQQYIYSHKRKVYVTNDYWDIQKELFESLILLNQSVTESGNGFRDEIERSIGLTVSAVNKELSDFCDNVFNVGSFVLETSQYSPFMEFQFIRPQISLYQRV